MGIQYNSVPPMVDKVLKSDDSIVSGFDEGVDARRVTSVTADAGEDITNDVTKVEQRYLNFNIASATTTLVKSGAGYIDEILVVGGTLGDVTIYNSLTAAGTVLLPTVTPVANGVLLKHVVFSLGLTIVTAAATVITGSYR